MMSFTLLALAIGAIGADTHGIILAAQFQNVDIIANMQSGWTDFLHTGKAGALAVGLIMGYTIRGITR